MRTLSTSSPTRYLAGAFGAPVAFVGLYAFFVRSYSGQIVDQLAFDGADFGSRSVTPVAETLLDQVPLVSAVIGLVLTLVIALARRNWVTLLVAVCVAGAAVSTTQILKYGVLSRPDLGVSGYASNSFPSGHTTVAAASALAVFLVSSPRFRPMVGAWGSAFAVAAGLSTVANQWHRPSDVIAGLLVVAFWGCVAGVVLASLPGRGLAIARPWRAGRLILLIAPFALVTALAFLITVSRATSDSTETLIAYIGGMAAIVAAGFALAVVGTRLFIRLP
ncbi:phosphatase PAP2 family protein [Glaciibacter psychrotolerans]|uniref:Membrane-associated phospholipid phosphatase n=1 Tax=Glaciibacter psychrotolerans TaxID=670054 RepID=A0A7Z0EB78_9MICO|nr:membrane-associated phospholipid phosphatase [Leifsonia psychrotolerans]